MALRKAQSFSIRLGGIGCVLNEKGEGTGQIIVAAKIKFDKKKGHYEIELWRSVCQGCERSSSFVTLATLRNWRSPHSKLS